MSDDGDRIDGEGRVDGARLACEGRAKKETDSEGKRRARSNTRTVRRQVHTLYDGQRVHPSPLHQQKSEDPSRRPIIAMDSYFMKMKSVVNAQKTSQEAAACIAVKEDTHQSIMSSVALKKGVEEPWTIERVSKFIDLLGHREITLKSDTEPAVIAFRNRVVKMCKAEVATEDIENAVMLIRGIT